LTIALSRDPRREAGEESELQGKKIQQNLKERGKGGKKASGGGYERKRPECKGPAISCRGGKKVLMKKGKGRALKKARAVQV